ncbi:MAG: hypothetical protein ACI35O_00975 [Bacillaceae bacterium]
MNKYTVFSLLFTAIFIVLFYLMANSISFGSFGKVVIVSMVLSPVAGAVLSLKNNRPFLRWTLFILNILFFCIICYLLLLAFNFGER